MPFTYMKIRARQKAIILPFGAVSVLLEIITFLLYCILSNSYNVGTLAPASGSTVYSSVSSSPPAMLIINDAGLTSESISSRSSSSPTLAARAATPSGSLVAPDSEAILILLPQACEDAGGESSAFAWKTCRVLTENVGFKRR